MTYIREEILRAASATGISVTELLLADREHFRQLISERYAKGATHWLWEHLDNAVSVQNHEAWKWIGEFVNNMEALMFFNIEDEPAIFRFPNGEAISIVLSNSHHFEFYIADSQATYLISFNHHDFLSGVGVARQWLEQKLK